MSNVEMKPIYFDRELRPVRKKERIENVFDCFSGIRVWFKKRVKKKKICGSSLENQFPKGC